MGKKDVFYSKHPYLFRIFFFIFFWEFWSHIISLLIQRVEGEKNLQDVSFIYCRKHLRPGFKVDFWISTLTHACREAGLTSWDESSMKVKRCVWLTHRTSDVLTQTSVSRRGAAASMWWKGLLGKSFSHPTLQSGLWPLLRFCHEKEMRAFILKY